MDLGLKMLVNGGLASSHVLTKVCAVSSLDSSLSSSTLLDRCAQSWTGAVLSDCKSACKVALGIGVCYSAWKIGMKYFLSASRLSHNALISLGEDTLDHIVANVNEDIEENSVQEQVMVGTIPIGIAREVPAEVKMKRRHRSKPFLTKIVHLAKNHFGGCPDSTKSNVMAVSKFVYDLCKEHNCLPHQTRMIISVTVPLILSPDEYDISSKALLNSVDLCENRARIERLRNLDGWLINLMCHPLSNKAWRRAFDNLAGLPDWKAFRLVN